MLYCSVAVIPFFDYPQHVGRTLHDIAVGGKKNLASSIIEMKKFFPNPVGQDFLGSQREKMGSFLVQFECPLKMHGFKRSDSHNSTSFQTLLQHSIHRMYSHYLSRSPLTAIILPPPSSLPLSLDTPFHLSPPCVPCVPLSTLPLCPLCLPASLARPPPCVPCVPLSTLSLSPCISRSPRMLVCWWCADVFGRPCF